MLSYMVNIMKITKGASFLFNLPILNLADKLFVFGPLDAYLQGGHFEDYKGATLSF